MTDFFFFFLIVLHSLWDNCEGKELKKGVTHERKLKLPHLFVRLNMNSHYPSFWYLPSKHFCSHVELAKTLYCIKKKKIFMCRDAVSVSPFKKRSEFFHVRFTADVLEARVSKSNNCLLQFLWKSQHSEKCVWKSTLILRISNVVIVFSGWNHIGQQFWRPPPPKH